MAEHALVTALTKLQYDLTAIKARVSEIQRQAATLGLKAADAPAFVCPIPVCRLGWTTERRLLEHLRNVHDIEPAA